MALQHILLTNDDGFDAKGIQDLYRACQEAGLKPIIVAPKKDCSGCGHGAHFHSPVMIEKRSQGYVIDGTTADCVYIALQELKLNPLAVFSGINHGANLGDDIWYSGTVAGAREAALHGIPAIAFSQVGPNREDLHRIAQKCVALYLESQPEPGDWWNYNFPENWDGVVTQGCFGRRMRGGATERYDDQRGKSWVWLGPPKDGIIKKDTDFYIISKNHISLTISGA